MDILNWVYLLKNKLVKTTVQDPAQDLVILGNNVSWVKRGDKYQSYGMTVTDFASSLISGTDYIIVQAKGTPEENAQEFARAYAKAVDADRDAEHRFTLVLSPGHYKFQYTFEHNQDYINIVSLTGEQDVIFDLELNGEDPLVLDTPPPPAVAFEYIYDLDIDINEGATTFSDSLQSGQPFFLNTTGQTLPEIIFDANGLGYRGNPYSTYPVYGAFSAGASEKVVVSYKFTYTVDTGDNYQQHNISLYDNSSATLPNFNSTNLNQLYCYVNNSGGGLNIQNPQGGGSIGLFLTDGEDYILELINDPGNSIQEAIVKDSSGTVIDSVSTPYFQITSGTYSVALGVDNQGPSYNPTLISTSSVMDIRAAYSTVSGIKTKEYLSNNYTAWSTSQWDFEDSYYPLPLNVIISDYADLEVKNCTAGPFSFGSAPTGDNFNDGNDLEATFTDCTALAFSFGFGARQIDSGSVFTNCKAGNYSFYIYDDLRGTYTDCTSGNYSFYSQDDDIEGTFTNCVAGDYSFYADDDAFTNNASFTNCTAGNDSFYANNFISSSVTFTNCTAGDYSFRASGNNNSGTYINCKAGISSFTADSELGGTFTDCEAGNDSFYTWDDLSGEFTNCKAGNNSFYSNNAALSGTFENCEASDDSFYAGSSITGTFTNCTAIVKSFTSSDRIDGTFNNCTATDLSFAAASNIYGTFTNCTANDNSFSSNNDSNFGTFNNCTGGERSFRANNSNSGTYINCIARENSFASGVNVYSSNLYYCLLYTSTFPGGTQTFCVDAL